MKIIETDNFGGDYPDESFVNLPSMPEAINEVLCGEGASRFWRVVHDDYKLQPGLEALLDSEGSEGQTV